MTTEDLLNCVQAIKNRIATKDAWCQHAPAVNIHNNSVGSGSPTAVRWCLIGALEVEVRNHRPLHNIDILDLLRNEQITLFTRCTDSLQIMNDELGFDAVHQLLDHTIEKLQEKIKIRNDIQSTGQDSTST